MPAGGFIQLIVYWHHDPVESWNTVVNSLWVNESHKESNRNHQELVALHFQLLLIWSNRREPGQIWTGLLLILRSRQGWWFQPTQKAIQGHWDQPTKVFHGFPSEIAPSPSHSHGPGRVPGKVAPPSEIGHLRRLTWSCLRAEKPCFSCSN